MRTGDTVKIIGERVGSMNEYAVVKAVYPKDRKVWVANLNMPFSGTVSAIVPYDQVEKQ
jgi:DNA-binding beta-propeller fold protein YncE